MPAAPFRPGDCPHCGATNPPRAAVCEYCGGGLSPIVLPASTGGAPAEDSFRLVTAPGQSPSGIGTALLIVGILVLLIGIGLLFAAAAAHQGVVSFNEACSQNPSCQPESDPSGAITAVGVVLILLGLVLSVYGYIRRIG